MAVISGDELKTLIEKQDDYCVSIFLPTHRSGPETQQDPIRLKNILKRVEDRLAAEGMRAAEARKMLQPATDLIPDNLFWSHQQEGLAVFMTPDSFQFYRLPLQFTELEVISDRFHIKPLLPILSGNGRFFILALAQKQLRLLECTRFSCEECDLDGVPESIDEILKYEEAERGLVIRSPQQEQAGIFHGHGGGLTDNKEKIFRFFRAVDKGLHNLLGQEKAPLITAGVEYLLPIFKEASTYPNLMEKGVTGNPEGLSNNELHEAAWEIVAQEFTKDQQFARERYYELSGTGKTGKDLKEVAEAALNARVDTLFVALGVQRWGSFDPADNTVTVHMDHQPGDDDLLDLAAVQTFLNGGAVYAVNPDEVPDDRNIAAIYRY